MTCKTCEFCNGEICICSGRYSEKALQGAEECNEWGASLEYYSEITEQAPWYIKEPYKLNDPPKMVYRSTEKK